MKCVASREVLPSQMLAIDYSSMLFSPITDIDTTKHYSMRDNPLTTNMPIESIGRCEQCTKEIDTKLCAACMKVRMNTLQLVVYY